MIRPDVMPADWHRCTLNGHFDLIIRDDIRIVPVRFMIDGVNPGLAERRGRGRILAAGRPLMPAPN
jgi:hypothetical protein